MATPLYRALRQTYPNARFTLISQLAEHPVLTGFNTFDAIVDYHPEINFSADFDLVVFPVLCGDSDVRRHFESHANVISADRLYQVRRRSPINHWDGRYSHVLFYRHQVEMNMELAGEAGYRGETPALYCPQGDAAAFETARSKIGLFINTPANEFQAMANRQWPAEHWKALVERLGISKIVLIGGGSDRLNVERLASETGAPFVITNSLAEFTGLCGALELLVTTDGGSMHFAATAGVPIISLHGTSSPVLLHPWIYPNGKCIAVLSPNGCSPCQRSYRLHLCETGMTRMNCMENIGPDMVERAVGEIGKLSQGTCLILKGDRLMTKAAYVKSWKRQVEFILNHNVARVALNFTSARVEGAGGSDRIDKMLEKERATDPAYTMTPLDPVATARGSDMLRDLTPNLHIFFSPHADDVVLSCGGSVHDLKSQQNDVKIVGVFAGQPESLRFSAFARHLHAKWRLHQNPVEERWREETAAMKELGVAAFEHWSYPEAPYRTASDGLPLYRTNEDLIGAVALEDRKLSEQIAHQVKSHLDKSPATTILYFPLALGGHVDHQILFRIGLELRAAGRDVRFYEDYPYAEAYRVNGRYEWQPEVMPISIEPKVKAAAAYTSQIRGLGGSAPIAAGRLARYAATVGNGRSSERYWKLSAEAAAQLLKSTELPQSPFVRREERPRLRDFGKFLRTFKWHDLAEVMPAGDGLCVDVGCGPGRHRDLIEERGYRWFGVDRKGVAGIKSDACVLPLRSESAAALVGWQVMEYVEQPEALIAEAARVLEPGGVFCGSASFLEPLHGRTYYNLSPLILEKLLRKQGFADVQIRPGLNGFVLMLWTWLRRCGIPFAERLAVPMALALLGPLAFLIFFTSWLLLRLGWGDGYIMGWLSQTAPLEFAGHLMFAARRARDSASDNLASS